MKTEKENNESNNLLNNLNEAQKSNIKSAYNAKKNGFISNEQFNDNLKKNGIADVNTSSSKKLPSEKLEVERLRNLTGDYNLNKVDSKKLDDTIRLKKKTPDDYYRNAPDTNEEKKRLDEVFGAKTDFSISNFENNYDKFNQEEKEMITHKMQLEFNNRG